MTTSDPAVLTVDQAGGVATVTLNRPARRNALNSELLSAIPETMSTLDDDPEVGAIVLTGAGPAFCAGLDLVELGDTASNLATGLGRPFTTTSTPVIGAVNGPAVTGGLELALCCDLLVASTEARFADTHAQVGVMPGWGLTVLLPEAVGLRRAREMSFSGRFLDPDTALAWGLVNHVVDADDLVGFAQDLATDIASLNRAGVARIRQTYAEVAGLVDQQALALEAEMGSAWLDSNFEASQVAERRSTIIDRGKKQIDQ